MTSEALYVSTDRLGVQRQGAPAEQAWEPPGPSAPGGASSAAPGGPALELRLLPALLEVLDERVFLAEVLEAAPSSVPGTVGARAARLVAEQAWDPGRAAGFALDCVEHAFSEEADLELPRGRTIGGVLAEARAALDRAGREEPGLFASLGRLAAASHLRRTRALLGSTAVALAREDDEDERDLLDDPAWTALAALGEAVLAALEALRLAVAPRYVANEEEAAESGDHAPAKVTEVLTPWGMVAVGAEHLPQHLPAARCAAEAAERCRQAVADRDGAPAGAEERDWQAERLGAVLAG